MSIGIVTNESSIALKEEIVENVYVAPTSPTDYVEVLSDGLELNKTREELVRNVLSSSVESEASRVGISEAAGSIPVEYKASATEGDAPQSMDILLRSLLGGKRQITTEQISDAVAHTDSTIYFADTSAFSIGDIVLVKEAGAYECRPISAIDAGVSISFPFPLTNGAPSSSVVVAQATTYYHDTANSISFSAEHNLGSAAIKQKASGLRCVSGAIENFSVGQLPTMNFGVQGLNIERVDEDAAYSPNFQADGLPPVALSACVWLGGQMMSYTELSLSIENTVSYIQDACSEEGRIGSRITEQVVTAGFNPYMDSSDLTRTWDKFNSNEDTSLFFYAFNPTAIDGEFGEVVAGWIPQAKVTESPVVDTDGIIGEQVTLKAHRSTGNDSIFLGMI